MGLATFQVNLLFTSKLLRIICKRAAPVRLQAVVALVCRLTNIGPTYSEASSAQLT